VNHGVCHSVPTTGPTSVDTALVNARWAAQVGEGRFRDVSLEARYLIPITRRESQPIYLKLNVGFPENNSPPSCSLRIRRCPWLDANRPGLGNSFLLRGVGEVGRLSILLHFVLRSLFPSISPSRIRGAEGVTTWSDFPASRAR